MRVAARVIALGMMAMAYSVSATCPDEATRDEYVAWLRGGHVDAVIAGGADSATIVVFEGEARPRAEVRYVFSSRERYERYLREHAPGLRAEGLAKFPPERGVVFARTLGHLV